MSRTNETAQLNIVRLILKIVFILMRRSLLAAFVLTLVAPVMIGIIALLSNDLEQLALFVVYILFFPSLLLQGKQSLDLGDIVLAFIVWNLIFELVGRLARFITKRELQVDHRIKVLHRTYLAAYVLGICSVPFLKLDNGTNVGMVLGVMFFFFVVGYGILGLFILFSKIEKYLVALFSGSKIHITRIR